MSAAALASLRKVDMRVLLEEGHLLPLLAFGDGLETRSWLEEPFEPLDYRESQRRVLHAGFWMRHDALCSGTRILIGLC